MSSQELKEIAWSNASSFEIDNPNNFKVCYICYADFLAEKLTRREVIMNHEQYEDGSELNGWCIDYIDGNKNNKVASNVVAVHCDCHKIKRNQDFSELFNEYKRMSEK